VMDRVKESLFSSIAADVPNADVLDLYAGAGSFGIEAMSRGAGSAVFVESGRKALDALRSNLASLGIVAEVVGAPVERYLVAPVARFDLVFCDPPWQMSSVDLAAILSAVVPALEPDATVVTTRKTGDDVPEVEGLRIADVRSHGDTTIIRYVMDE
jgi:16S rRNA (guanine966-N2)-methyltransferase